MLLIYIAAFWSVFTSVPEFKDMSDQFYLGVENPISIRLNQCEAEDIQIKVSEGSLHKRSDSTYIYMGHQAIEELKIKLYYKKILCAVKVVSVTNLPTPTITLSNESDGMIRIADLSSSVTLGFNMMPITLSNSKATLSPFRFLSKINQGCNCILHR